MDDLQSKIGQIMSDPQAMEQIQSLGKMLGLSQENQSIPQPEAKQPQPEDAGISKIIPILNTVRQEDETARLLTALRPFLSSDKQKRIDEAKKMLQFLKIVPLLKQGGLF